MKTKVLVIDNDPGMLAMLERILKSAGFEVRALANSGDALDQIRSWAPMCVITDLMMPNVDGHELTARIKSDPALKAIKVIMITGKNFEYDRNHAFALGVDDYILKPIGKPEPFCERVQRVIREEIAIKFWGVRGTLPVPGTDTTEFGGNTSCVSVEFPGKPMFIFDAGSGIKSLGDSMMGSRADVRFFISHPHWDHVNALPFFTPLYIPGNYIKIFGPKSPTKSIQQVVSDQMQAVFFPITVQAFGAHIDYQDLAGESIVVDGIQVRTAHLCHPGACLGYRLQAFGKSIAYCTDNELYLKDTPQFSQDYWDKLVSFVSGADILITDTTYTDDQYPRHVNWGHSSVSRVAELAHEAKVKTLCLFHHDPGQKDGDIAQKHADALKFLEEKESEVECLAPKEGEVIKL